VQQQPLRAAIPAARRCRAAVVNGTSAARAAEG
jgi:hypothetical protein